MTCDVNLIFEASERMTSGANKGLGHVPHDLCYLGFSMFVVDFATVLLFVSVVLVMQ